MSCLKASPIIFQVIATLFLIVAICMTLTAILTHSWQNFTTSDSGKKETHKHGLWMDCIDEEFFSTNSKTQTCFFKFHSEDKGQNTITHDGHNHGNQNFNSRNNFGSSDHQIPGHKHQHKVLSLPARKTIMALLCVAVALGLVGLLFSFCAPCVKWCSVIWSSFCLLSTILCLAGIIVFFVNSHDFERSYYSGNAQTTQAHGFSFYFGVIGCGLFLFSTILSVLTTVLHFAVRHREPDYAGNANKTWPKIYNHHNTAV